MTSNEIRQQFMDFFIRRCGHTFAPGAPVVPPPNETTLLFTNAGMNQFKDVFLGAGTRGYTRAVNSQPCIRASGKHNDLEDVGRSLRHHTLFEMLGNWSFGDYFKKEAITWAWQLLTEVWKLPKERLWATVYRGNPAAGIPADDEAAELWKTCTDIDPAHILYFGEDNFWAAGEVGPCGPCSEIHIDRTPNGKRGPREDADDPRVMEIWNLVFIQYNRDSAGKLTSLPAKHVDTGMGLERIVSVLQGTDNNYATDLFGPLMAEIERLTGSKYTGLFTESSIAPEQYGKDLAIRVIADHIRCLTFALSDGASIGNKGRDAVLRSILRRASRFAWQKLHRHEPVLYKLVPTVVAGMGHFFSHLKTKPQAVAEAIRNEEEQFLRTLENGIALFEQSAAAVVKEHAVPSGDGRRPCHTGQLGVISAKVAFDLYTTFGFPFDLTRQMAAERGLAVDETGFARLMDEHAEISRGGSDKFAAEEASSLSAEVLDELKRRGAPETDDSPKFQSKDISAQVLAIVQQGRLVEYVEAADDGHVCVILDRTPMYVEMGGQIGDVGRLVADGELEITGVTKSHGYILHDVKLASGKRITVGQTVQVRLWPQRSQVRVHHTATHLLHWALREVFGPGVQQRGSYVGPDRLRFDFDLSCAPKPEDLVRVEELINQRIADEEDVVTFEMSQNEARKTFADKLRAFFGDKYGDRVRVVTLAQPQPGLDMEQAPAKPTADYAQRTYSVEFCGGTHVANTAQLGALAMVSESAVSKGIRRIEAVAGEAARKAEENAHELNHRVAAIKKAALPDWPGQIASLLADLDEKVVPLGAKRSLREEIARLQEQLKAHAKEEAKAAAAGLHQELDGLLASAVDAGGVKVIVAAIGDVPQDAARTAMDSLRKQAGEAAILLAAVGSAVTLHASATPAAMAKGLKAGDWVKAMAPLIGGKGGGKPDMAQAGGKDASAVPAMLVEARQWAVGKLSG